MSTGPRESQVRCVEMLVPTHYGPRDAHWSAQVTWTDWSNGEGGDLAVSLGPHESGHLRLTWTEVEAVSAMLRHLLAEPDEPAMTAEQRDALLTLLGAR